MGDVHPPPVRRSAVQVDAARRRQGGAARRGGPAQLERAALDRHPGDQGVIMATINLPTADGRITAYTTQPPRDFPEARPPFNRVAYAAAHVVADPLADND